jgi:hypothetical protein
MKIYEEALLPTKLLEEPKKCALKPKDKISILAGMVKHVRSQINADDKSIQNLFRNVLLFL